MSPPVSQSPENKFINSVRSLLSFCLHASEFLRLYANTHYHHHNENNHGLGLETCSFKVQGVPTAMSAGAQVPVWSDQADKVEGKGTD
jgi:hypothetical protein